MSFDIQPKYYPLYMIVHTVIVYDLVPIFFKLQEPKVFRQHTLKTLSTIKIMQN